MKKHPLFILAFVVAACTVNTGQGRFVSYDTDVVPMVADSSYHFVNTASGEEVECPGIKECTAFLNGVAVASDGNAEFYVGKDGRRLLDESFAAATLFSEGMAWVMDADGTFWAINRKGKKLFSESGVKTATVFYQGRSVLETESGIKVVDKNGRTLLQKSCSGGHVVVDGLMVAQDGLGNVGLIDLDGRYMIEPRYASIGGDEYSDLNSYIANLASGALIACDDRALYGVIDRSGVVLIPFEYDDIVRDGDMFLVTKDNQKQETVQKLWLSPDGNVLIDKGLDMACEFAGGDYAAVYESINGRWGFIDKHGNWKIEPKFSGYARSFDENGLAAVDDADSNSGLVDENGDYVVKSDYQYISRIKGTDRYFFALDDKIGIMDKTGATLVEPKYDWCGGIYSGEAPLDYDSGFSPHLFISSEIDQ